MPETAAPAADWQTLATRLSAEIETLHASVEQLIAGGVENAQLDDQALEASMTASEITYLLLGLERNATATHRPA
ncbi:hypothetical protein ACFXB3_07265 [Streptomyces sp. NPDC059447]|uniref:hypothetical protein n=1 Tax=Streptomyces sp. NPDC059447 TaxID=3346834 RepID=UPI0036838F27